VAIDFANRQVSFSRKLRAAGTYWRIS
jgi:hypothetical protein